MKTKTLIWLTVLLLSINLVLALGIQPAKTTIIAETTSHYSGQFMIVNTEGAEFQVKVYAQGDFAPYIKLNITALTFSAEDTFKIIPFEIDLPPLIPPGVSTSYIVAEEELLSSDPNVISSKLLLKHKIIIQGEYPDKYVEVKLNFQEQPTSIKMVSEIENKGKQDLQQVQTTFYVNDKEQKEHILETSSKPLSTNDSQLFSAEIPKDNFQQGEYTVRAITTYDDLEVEMVQEMRVGQPEVDITYFTPFFIAQKVNEYSLDLLNKWNKEIKNVFVDIEVLKDNKKIDQFRTQSVDLSAEQTKRLQNYFDARNKNEGTYNFDMTVNFWDNYRMTKKTFQSELLSETEFEKVNSKDANSPSSAISITSSLTGKVVGIVLTLFLLIGIMISYLFYRSKREKEEGKEKGKEKEEEDSNL